MIAMLIEAARKVWRILREANFERGGIYVSKQWVSEHRDDAIHE